MQEKQLLAGLRRKEEDALMAFIEDYAGLMKSVIHRVLWQFPSIQEEVLNDAVLAVWQHIEDYDEHRSSFKNWCAAIARYRAINAYKKEQRQLQTVAMQDEMMSLPDETPLPFEESVAIEHLLADLSEKDRRIFHQLFIDEEAYEQVAKREGLTLGALYNRISRGRKRLQRRKEAKKYE